MISGGDVQPKQYPNSCK